MAVAERLGVRLLPTVSPELERETEVTVREAFPAEGEQMPHTTGLRSELSLTGLFPIPRIFETSPHLRAYAAALSSVFSVFQPFPWMASHLSGLSSNIFLSKKPWAVMSTS